MTDLEVRRPKFDFDSADVPFIWNPQNPAFSFQMNATSIMIVAFEKMIVAAVREAMPTITDPEVAAEADAFLRQEAQHASAHRQHVRALIQRYPGLEQTFDDVIRQLRRHHRNHPAEVPACVCRGHRGDLHAEFQDDAGQRGDAVPAGG